MFLANAVYSCLMQFNMFFSSSQCNATRFNFNSMPFWGEALCGSAEVAQTFFSSRQSLAIFSQFELALHTACNLHWNFCFLMVSVFSLKRCIAWYIANPYLAKQWQKYALFNAWYYPPEYRQLLNENPAQVRVELPDEFRWCASISHCNIAILMKIVLNEDTVDMMRHHSKGRVKGFPGDCMIAAVIATGWNHFFFIKRAKYSGRSQSYQKVT